jgi:hypothetical protein
MDYVADTLATSRCGHKLLAACALLALAAGCASAAHGPRSEAQLNAAFARIQTYEAEIAAAERRIVSAAGACAALCEPQLAACSASDALCELAAELSDADALTRCGHAQDACDGMRAQAATCGCSGGDN